MKLHQYTALLSEFELRIKALYAEYQKLRQIEADVEGCFIDLIMTLEIISDIIETDSFQRTIVDFERANELLKAKHENRI